MSRIIIILYCLTWQVSSNAQVSGVVMDMETRKPLRDVMIYTDTQKNIITDWAGRFKTNERFSSVTFSHGSYLQRTLRREEMRDTIYMLPKINELAEVFVYGSKPGPKFNYSGMTKIDAQLANYHGGGFNPLGFISLAVDALTKDKHKMTKKQKAKQILDNY